MAANIHSQERIYKCATCEHCSLDLDFDKEIVKRVCAKFKVEVDKDNCCAAYNPKGIKTVSDDIICNAHCLSGNELYCDNLDC